MNIVSYNLVKYQSDNKLSNKQMAERFNYPVKQIKQMKKETYIFNQEEINFLSKKMLISEEELSTQMNERINLKEKKIYGTDYLFLNYKVINYKRHNINLISATIDLLYFIILAVLLACKLISLDNSQTQLLNILKVTFIIELFVFPFMFIVLPLLKIYFNRTYEAVLVSNVKEYYQDEACGIVHSCLRRSINKSIVPYFFTLFSEGVIALYCLFSIINTQEQKIGYLIMLFLFILSLVISIYSFKYHREKHGNIVKKEM